MIYGIKNDIFNDMINIFEDNQNIEQVFLFGSRARGNYSDVSDIDIALVSKEDVSLETLRSLEEIRCILTFDVVSYKHIGTKLKENIDKDKICIYKRA